MNMEFLTPELIVIVATITIAIVVVATMIFANNHNTNKVVNAIANLELSNSITIEQPKIEMKPEFTIEQPNIEIYPQINIEGSQLESKKTVKKPAKNKPIKNKKVTHKLALRVKDELPRVSKLKHQLTDEQCENLIDKYGFDLCWDLLLGMENWNKISTKSYVSLTIHSWAKRRIQQNKDNNELELIKMQIESGN